MARQMLPTSSPHRHHRRHRRRLGRAPWRGSHGSTRAAAPACAQSVHGSALHAATASTSPTPGRRLSAGCRPPGLRAACIGIPAGAASEAAPRPEVWVSGNEGLQAGNLRRVAVWAREEATLIICPPACQLNALGSSGQCSSRVGGCTVWATYRNGERD
eukprot:246884-Chlamydomonas_euryale.AAC.2